MTHWTNEERAVLDTLAKGSPERAAMVREKMAELGRKSWEAFHRKITDPAIGWYAPYARLKELLPVEGVGFSPFSILDAAETLGIPFEQRTVYNPWRTHTEGIGDKSWDDYQDADVFELLFGEFPLTPGALWFIPDDCFYTGNRHDTGEPYRNEPYLLDASELRELVYEYLGKWNWGGQLNVDTIFLWRDTPRITLIHHEGWLYNLVLPGA